MKPAKCLPVCHCLLQVTEIVKLHLPWTLLLILCFLSGVYKRENNTVNSYVWGHFKTKNGIGSAEKRIDDPWCSWWDVKAPKSVWKCVKLTPATVKDCLKYPDELSDWAQETKMMMMTRFVSQSSNARMMQLIKYCTGSKMMPSVQNFAINVYFHSENYISSSTCTFTLLMPDHFPSYGLFELSLN